MLCDGRFEALNENDFSDVMAAKYPPLKYLDAVTREICGDTLKYFVAFSSIASGRGNLGQSNYGWANSAMERLCQERRNDDLPGKIITGYLSLQ